MTNYYKPGDYNVICDRCGMKRKASQCRMTWDSLFVCADRCWMPRHPQDFVEAVLDDQSVSIARPGVQFYLGETTVLTTALINATSIDITSIIGLADKDALGIVLDNGACHWTYSNGTPSGNTVTLGSYLPSKATAGNAVYLPSINNEDFTTATTLTATGL